MNEETKKLIMFLLANADKEVVFGTHISRSRTLTSEDFTLEDGKLFLDTYEGM